MGARRTSRVTRGPLHVELSFLYLNFRPIDLLACLMEAELLFVLRIHELGVHHLVHPACCFLLLPLQWLGALGTLLETSVECVVLDFVLLLLHLILVHLLPFILKIAELTHLNTVPYEIGMGLCLVVDVCIILVVVRSSCGHTRFVELLRYATILARAEWLRAHHPHCKLLLLTFVESGHVA